MQKLLVVSVAPIVVAAAFAFADASGAERLNAPRAQCLYASDITQEYSAPGYRSYCCRPCLSDRLKMPRGQWLSASEITQKLTVQGYQVHEIEVDDGAYEFEATNVSGIRIEGHAHPATGEVYLSALCCSPCLAI